MPILTPKRRGELLKELREGITSDLKASDDANRERFTRYRSAGEKLIRAKQVCIHGEWTTWLKENCQLSERQAQRFMRFAKTTYTSDLEKEEKEWQRISGNSTAKTQDDQEKAESRRLIKTMELWIAMDGLLNGRGLNVDEVCLFSGVSATTIRHYIEVFKVMGKKIVPRKVIGHCISATYYDYDKGVRPFFTDTLTEFSEEAFREAWERRQNRDRSK